VGLHRHPDATATAKAAGAGSNILSGIVGLAVNAAVLLHIDVWLGLGTLLTVPPLILGIDAISPRLEARLRERAQAAGLAAALAAELVHALGPLRAFGGTAQALRRYRLASSRCLDADIAAASADAVVSGVGLVATGIVTVAIASAAGWMAFDGRIDVGQFVTVVAMASFVGDPVSRVAFGVQRLAAARASAARIAALLGPAPMTEAAHGAPADSADADSVTLREITLGPVRALTLRLDPGGVVGMVARDPAAVTTVLDILAGDIGPAEGTACLGERPLHTIERHLLRRHILVAPHEVHLLGRTLSDALDTGRGADPAGTAAALAAATAPRPEHGPSPPPSPPCSARYCWVCWWTRSAASTVLISRAVTVTRRARCSRCSP
jgi:putative ABC transport system ATP-binding protein